MASHQNKGVRVRITGPVAMADDEFGTVADGALLNVILTAAAVLLILWFALRSGRLMFAVMLSLLVGLSITAAVGLAMVGTLNLISVAFAVLFVGIGVDFGIQVAVRYRQERHFKGDLQSALAATAARIAKPLTLAATATAAGFYAFLPTDYRGVSELGLISGTGMIVAFLISITLLPGLLVSLKPPPEPEAVGYRRLAPVDRFMARYRVPILVVAGLAIAAGLPLFRDLSFDFNPLNLRSAKVEFGRNASRLSEGPRDNAKRDQCADAQYRRCRVAGAASRPASRGVGHRNDPEFRAEGSGGEASDHPGCRSSARANPRSA